MTVMPEDDAQAPPHCPEGDPEFMPDLTPAHDGSAWARLSWAERLALVKAGR